MKYEQLLSKSDKSELKGFEYAGIINNDGEAIRAYTLIDADPSQWNPVLGVAADGELIDMGSE